MMRSRPKVLFISPFPPPHGGVANHAQTLFDSELNNSFDLVKLNLSMADELTENVSEKRAANWKKGWRGLMKLISRLRRERPEIVYVEAAGDWSFLREMVYMAAVRMLSRARIVMHFHGMLDPANRKFPFSRDHAERLINRVLINAFFRCNHRSIFLSPAIQQEFKGVLSQGNWNRSEVVENFIDITLFSPKPQSESRVKRVLFIGRLSRAKGFFDLVEVIPQIADAHPEIQFHVCGAPETDHALAPIRDLITDLEARGVLHLHGVVSGDQKRKMFADADLLVFPTHQEIFPLVVLEGLAQGLPLVTTRAGVIDSVVKHEENGLLVGIGDKTELAAAIERLVSDAALRHRMAIRNREKAESAYDLSVAVAKLKHVFENQLKHAPGRSTSVSPP